ncbi:MAG: hypothetical protein Unbinned6437contig1000_14 [Prokaryotic dsDNA virus sp.]|nr:MAG: hypothetical protein Unbinned6437contig1000_14 [Prokaryotic dsDNA virus sp.]|tara:strand:- start:38064 stop:38216 length:153 start_codon:yes stop_codon:yes gene_type:complete
MAKGKLMVDFKIKHTWFIMPVNYMLINLGFNPWIPSFCIKLGKPYFVEGK